MIVFLTLKTRSGPWHDQSLGHWTSCTLYHSVVDPVGLITNTVRSRLGSVVSYVEVPSDEGRWIPPLSLLLSPETERWIYGHVGVILSRSPSQDFGYKIWDRGPIKICVRPDLSLGRRDFPSWHRTVLKSGRVISREPENFYLSPSVRHELTPRTHSESRYDLNPHWVV